MSSTSNSATEQDIAWKAEEIKEKGYEMYYKRKTLMERVAGMELVIEGCWIRESMFPLIPPSLEEYRKNYITSHQDNWDPEVMMFLIDKYGTVANSKIPKGYRSWQA